MLPQAVPCVLKLRPAEQNRGRAVLCVSDDAVEATGLSDSPNGRGLQDGF